jgi:hypothetical protein
MGQGYTASLSCHAHRLSKQYQHLFINKGKTQKQWLGGDNANSIWLDSDRVLWTFGDTLWGKYPERKNSYRTLHYFTHDSFGIVNHKEKRMIFYTNESEEGKPTSFFVSKIPNHYYWILSGTRVGSSLIFGLADILQKEKGFEVVGTSFAIISNPSLPPEKWHIKMVSLSSVMPALNVIDNYSWNVSLIVHQNDVYLFGRNNNPLNKKGMVLARININDLLESKWMNMTFLIDDKPKFHSHFKKLPIDSSELKRVEGLPDMSEASIYFDKKNKRWVTLAIPFMTYDVMLYTSPHLMGPWENKGQIYRIPAPWRTTQYKGKSLFISYAPKIHPELASASDKTNQLAFVFSYINNLNEFDFPGISKQKIKATLRQYTDFYQPILVKVRCKTN